MAFPCIWGLEIVEERDAEPPFGEERWSELTLRALKDLGGESQMVVGAKLRQKMVELGRAQDLDVAAFVAGSADSFSVLLDGVAGVVARRRPGSDVLVGTASAKEPEWQRVSAGSRGALRGDVYQAFTRVVLVPFVRRRNERYSPMHAARRVVHDAAGQCGADELRRSVRRAAAGRTVFSEGFRAAV